MTLTEVPAELYAIIGGFANEISTKDSEQSSGSASIYIASLVKVIVVTPFS